MMTATQSLVDSFNLQLAVYKSQILTAYKNFLAATSDKNMADLMFDNAISFPSLSFENERIRLKERYASNYTYLQAIDAIVNAWLKTIYTQVNPSVLSSSGDYPAGQYKYATPDLAAYAFNLSDKDAIRRVVWNDFIFWAEIQKTYKILLPFILELNNWYLIKRNADEKYAIAAKSEAAKKAAINTWLDTYRIYNFDVPTYDLVLADALASETQSIQEPVAPAIETFPSAPQATLTVNPPEIIYAETIVPVPGPDIQEPAIQYPVVALEETPLRAADAVSISTQTGPSVELGTSTKIALAPAPKSNTSLILAAAAAVGFLMLKRKK